MMQLSEHGIQWLRGSQWRHAKAKRLNGARGTGQAERALMSTLARRSRRNVPAEEQRSGIQCLRGFHWRNAKAKRLYGARGTRPR